MRERIVSLKNYTLDAKLLNRKSTEPLGAGTDRDGTERILKPFRVARKGFLFFWGCSGLFINMLKSKIHKAVVTEANLNYMGSITIDSALLKVSEILPNEQVQIVNNNNGARFETYVIPGPENSGVICLNGAAARLVQPGDKVIIISYCLLSLEEAGTHKPTVVMVDENNCVAEIRKVEHHGESAG